MQTNEKSALIPIRTSKKFGQVVSARELYDFLEIKSKFSDWFRNRISKYGFTENQDFVTFSKNLENGGREIEYALTLDAAKELAMVEGNSKGKEARQYFIECEKQLREINPPQIPQTLAQALRLAAELEEQREKLLLENEELRPKAEYTDRVLLSTTELTTTTIAKEFGMTAISLNRLLMEKRIQFYHDGHYVLYQKYASQGYASLRTYQYHNRKGESMTNHYLVWTEAGRKFIHDLLNA